MVLGVHLFHEYIVSSNYVLDSKVVEIHHLKEIERDKDRERKEREKEGEGGIKSPTTMKLTSLHWGKKQ